MLPIKMSVITNTYIARPGSLLKVGTQMPKLFANSVIPSPYSGGVHRTGPTIQDMMIIITPLLDVMCFS